MKVTSGDISSAILRFGMQGKPVLMHSSLKSFGFLEGGPATLIGAFLEQGCTLMAPAFSYSYSVQAVTFPAQNGWDYNNYMGDCFNYNNIFTTSCNDVAQSMGAFPKAMLKYPGRKRGYHPLNSFVAVGPLAGRLVDGQTPANLYAPVKELRKLGGYILLAGVDLTSMTAIHSAEQDSGRNVFIRWANGLDGRPIETAIGSCSRGFNIFNRYLKDIETRCFVGESLWRVFPADVAVQRCTDAIKQNQSITRCRYPGCKRCRDALLGGPVYNA